MSHAPGGTCEIEARLSGADRARVAITRLIERRHETLVCATTVIDRAAIDIYAFWRDPANLPRVIGRLDRVIVLEAGRSLWIGRKSGGQRIERVCTLTHDKPGRVIAWEAQGVTLIGSRRLSLTPVSDRATRVTLTSVLPPAPFMASDRPHPSHHGAPALRSIEVLHKLRDALQMPATDATLSLPGVPLFDRLTLGLGHRLGLVRA